MKKNVNIKKGVVMKKIHIGILILSGLMIFLLIGNLIFDLQKLCIVIVIFSFIVFISIILYIKIKSLLNGCSKKVINWNELSIKFSTRGKKIYLITFAFISILFVISITSLFIFGRIEFIDGKYYIISHLKIVGESTKEIYNYMNYIYKSVLLISGLFINHISIFLSRTVPFEKNIL